MTTPQAAVDEGIHIPPEAAATAVLIAAETALAAAVLAAYTTWLAAASTAVLAAFNRLGLAPDPNAIWALTTLWNRLINPILRDLEKLARQGWEDAARQLGVNLPYNPNSATLQAQLEQTRNLLVRTPDEAYRMVIKALARSQELGETVARQAARVREVLDVTGSENWPSRAETVAITEVNRVYAFGMLAAGFSTGNPQAVDKVWDAKHDSATRRAHRDAHGQRRILGDPFLVGGELLMAPLDPAGSPENVINCRCRMRFEKVRP